MSQRTIVEFNHDLAHRVGEEPKLPEMLLGAMSSGDTELWESLERLGIYRIIQRHHSDNAEVVVNGHKYRVP